MLENAEMHVELQNNQIDSIHFMCFFSLPLSFKWDPTIHEIILGAEYLILTVLPNVVHLMRILSEFKPFQEGGISSGESYFQN